MKFRVVSISQHGANYHVKMRPLTEAEGDVLLSFPSAKSKPTFHAPTEIRNVQAGTFKQVIPPDSHIIALDTEEGGRFELNLAACPEHAAQSGEYDVNFSPVAA